MEDRRLRLVRSADDLPRPAHFHPRDSFVPRRHDHSTPHIASRNVPHTDSQCQWNTDLIGVVGNWLSRVQNASLVMNVNDVAYALCVKYRTTFSARLSFSLDEIDESHTYPS